MTEQINASETIVKTTVLKSGIYFYSIIQNGITVKSDKLMIR